MTTKKSGIPAVGDLLTFVGANIQDITPDRAARALALLRTGSSGLERPIINATQVPFNKVSEAVIDPGSGEVYFVGISDDKIDKKPAKLYKLTLSGRPQVIAESGYICRLMMLGGQLAWVRVEETTPHLCVYTPKVGTRSWQLDSAVTISDKFFAFNNGRTFARTCTVPSHTFELVGEGIRNARGGHLENHHGMWLDVFDNDLFLVEWDDEWERDHITVHRETPKGGISRRHENCEFIGGSAFCDKDGTVWYVVDDKKENTYKLCSLARRAPHREVRLEGNLRNPIIVSTGQHGFLIEQMAPGEPQCITHLLTGVELSRALGHVTSIKVVEGKAVFVLARGRSSCYLYVWPFDQRGELQVGDALNPLSHVSCTEVGACEPRLVQFGDWVGLEYAQSAHTIDWRNAESRFVEFPRFAPADRLTQTADGRVLSWHFDSGTFFITDYTPDL